MAILKAAIITVTPFQQNCSVIWKEETKIAAVTDPGGDLESVSYTHLTLPTIITV